MARLLWAVGGPEQEYVPRNGKAFALDELQTIVGGYIETVATPDGHIMILNEDGKRLNLPLNEAATLIMHARPWLLPDDFIVGNVLICTRDELGEDDDALDLES